jgi:hypothetical protein
VARDDFSTLQNDIFKDLIVKSSVGRSSPSIGDRSHGVAKLEPSFLQAISQEYFINKSKYEVIELFKNAQGSCDFTFKDEAVLMCEVVRQWKLKDVGAKYHGERPKPTAKLGYKFHISDSLSVVGVEVNISDVTIYQRRRINKE